MRRGKSWVVYYRAGNGKQSWKSFPDKDYGGTADERKRQALAAAELHLANARAQQARGESPARHIRVQFRDFAAEWLRDYAKTNVGPKTFEGYEGVLRNHLVPEFGHLFLSDITRKTIDAFVADWTSGGPRYQGRLEAARKAEAALAEAQGREPRGVRFGRSPKTVANALVPLREMLGHAVEWGYLTANPAAGVRRPRTERRHDEMHVLSPDEIGRLLDAADPVGRTLLLCAVTTGVRRGELLGLRWGDVDSEARRLWVRRSVGLNGSVQQPKTRTSIRAVAMTPTLLKALRTHRMASAFKGEDDYVFPSDRGTPLDGGNTVKRYFTPALRRAKLPRIRFHDLRHTYASLLIAEGLHPKYISEQLGHASVQITLDRYGHLMDQSYSDGSDRLEAALFGPRMDTTLQAVRKH
jgi:integrase